MTPQDKKEVVGLLVTAKKLFPHSQLDNDAIAMYAELLNGFSSTEVKAGLTKCLRTVKFFPTVAEIIEAIESVKATANGEHKPDAGEAWAEAINNVRENGCYKPWKYSCREVEAACKRFGVQELIYLEEEQVNTARAQFFKIYNEILSRGRREADDKKVLLSMGGKADELIANVAKLKLVEG